VGRVGKDRMMVIRGGMSTVWKGADVRSGVIGAEGVIGAKRGSAMFMEEKAMGIGSLVVQSKPTSHQGRMLHGICLRIRHLLKPPNHLTTLRLERHFHTELTAVSTLGHLRLRSFTYRLLHLPMNPHGHPHQRASELLRIL
jgi:hypothetical protein